MIAHTENLEGGKPGGERVAKAIARSGLCSRREAEALIADKRVSVNGTLIESAALDILPADRVLVDGKPLSRREPPRLWRYYKPKGRVTTHKDPQGRPTVFEALPEGLPRLISVGRLDYNTEGLLLLTNDGDLARHLELPSTGWTRRYRVRAFGDVSEAQLKELRDGVTIDRMAYGPVEASLEREQGDNVWLTVAIREGKNREVRRIMEHLGLTVNRLIRVSFGPFMLGELEPGQIEEVKTAVLKDQLGARLSRQLGVRREPLREERQLAPGRAKPSYLRRKPGKDERPERPAAQDRPLKRRRIFLEDGAGAPTVEYVAEPRPREDRAPRTGERRGKPGGGRDERDKERAPFRSRPDRKPRGERFEARSDAGEGSKPWKKEEARPWRKPEGRDSDAFAGKEREAVDQIAHDRPESQEADAKPQRPEWKNRERDAERPRFRKSAEPGAQRPEWKNRERPAFAKRDDAGEAERPRFRKSTEAGAEQQRPEWKSRERPHSAGHEDAAGAEKPRFRRSADAGARPQRPEWKSRERPHSAGHEDAAGGEKPRFRRSTGAGARPQRPEWKSRERPHSAGHEDGAGAERPRFRKSTGAGARPQRPEWKSRERPHSAGHENAAGAERPRFRGSAEAGARPQKPEWKSRERPAGHEDGAGAERPRFPRSAEAGARPQKPEWKSRESPHSAGHEDGAGAERPRFRKSTEAGARPQKPEWKSRERPAFAKRDDAPDAERPRFSKSGPHEKDRQHRPRRFEAGPEGEAREGRPRRFEAAMEGEARERQTSGEGGVKKQQASFSSGGRKPFKAGKAGGKPFAGGGERPHHAGTGEGKPFRKGGKPAQARRHGPGKPKGRPRADRKAP